MLRLPPLITLDDVVVMTDSPSVKCRPARSGHSPNQLIARDARKHDSIPVIKGDDGENPLGIVRRLDTAGQRNDEGPNDTSHHSLFGSVSLNSQNAFQYDVTSIQFLLKYAQRKKKVNAETQMRTVDYAHTAMRAGQETLSNRRRTSSAVIEATIALSPPSPPKRQESVSAVVVGAAPFHRVSVTQGVTPTTPRSSHRVSSTSAPAHVPTSPSERRSAARRPFARRASKEQK